MWEVSTVVTATGSDTYVPSGTLPGKSPNLEAIDDWLVCQLVIQYSLRSVKYNTHQHSPQPTL